MRYQKGILLLVIPLFTVLYSYAQYSIPSSSTVNVTFGEGSVNPGPPLAAGSTSYTYTTASCPPAGSYTILNQQLCEELYPFKDAGHIFSGPKALPGNESGYVMLVRHITSDAPKILFADTVRNLCGSTSYLFWAGIMNVSSGTCVYPNFTLSAETLSGQTIQSFQTGDIGGANDNWAWYPGFYDPSIKPDFTFYGGVFNLPQGITDIVVKIIANPSAQYYCDYTCIIDNIFLTPVGPDIRISPPGNPDAWVTAACFQGNKPVVLTGNVGTSYHNFGETGYTNAGFADPAFQWQQSVDNGFTWVDIPGATGIDLSHNFSLPDTFFVRLRTSESGDIHNPNCSVLSNIVKVEVDGLPVGFTLNSNSPVCTDGDLTFEMQGGASYTMTGPNGFFDDSPFPHIYNPGHADSGWYYATMITFGGCEVKDSTYVVVIGPDLKTGPDQSICYGETVQLQASGGETYLWMPSTGLSATNIPDPFARPLVTTKYQVKVIDQSGCGAQAYVTLTLKNDLLKANIIGPPVVCPDDMALFKDSSSGKITNWNWDFGNGFISNSQNPPPQTFIGAGAQTNFPVKLTVKDSSGCTNTTLTTIKAVSNCHIAIPSAFTPNNDSRNDYLYPLNAYNATNLIFRVYNRMGQIVFETRDWTKKWDGNFNGSPQPTGTYVWILNYTDSKTGENVHKSGTTVLIR